MSIFKKGYWKEVFSPALIIQTTMQTIIGSVLVGTFFMLLSDYVFQPKDLSGPWTLKLEPKDATAQMNECVDLSFHVLIMQKDIHIIATGEKTLVEKSNTAHCSDYKLAEEEEEIPTGHGKIIHITGFIKNNYFENDVLTLSYLEGEKNHERFTTATLEISDNEITGTYYSQIARAHGTIHLTRSK